jgi:hypothetical protein
MDPDREALEKALRRTDLPWLNLDRVSVSVDTEWFNVIREAARRDLARLEEKPKRASLVELVGAVEHAYKATLMDGEPDDRLPFRGEHLKEAAAVLRAVGEFRVGVDDCETDGCRAYWADHLRRKLP